ncbi:leucine-rich repeat domain-containing protein [Haloplasma contractile]|uniref:Cell surface protein Leucine-rich repeat protein n=1 Tax=Haloplasma contractile SSD-17B TaxID=1033810 RepID=F7Q0U2_9MOLU|nr:leucine-rich repeat domain-containing protein [Haloplasma contractile]ERJ11316.1 putative cell surface protein Leucine-rich repeat protein [Haloplasma contractile SSD-17B]
MKKLSKKKFIIIATIIVLFSLLFILKPVYSKSSCFEFDPDTGTKTDYKEESMLCNTNVLIPDKIKGIEVTKIGDYAFASNQLSSVVIPNSVTKIGESAFSHNQLTNVMIPESVKIIEDNTFYSNKLTRIIIPNQVTSIGHYAFMDNYLTNVTIPKNVMSIGVQAFDYNEITSVAIEGDENRFNAAWETIGFPVELRSIEPTE